jgi:hypothetical protein
MAAQEEAVAIEGEVAAPSNQENRDPVVDGSLSKMFAEGNTLIGTHR